MNDRIEIDGKASGSDDFLRMAEALDRIDATLGRLANTAGEALSRMDREMKTMQASIATSMAAMVAETEASGEKLAEAAETTSMKAVMAAERGRDKQLAVDRTFLSAKAAVYHEEEELAQQWQAMLDSVHEKALAGEILFEREVARLGQQRVAQRALDYAREEELAGSWQAMLDASREKELAGEALFNRTVIRLEQERQAELAALRSRSATSIDARTLLGLPSEAEVRSESERIAAQMREAVAQSRLNASYSTAGPASQLQTQMRAAGYSAQGLNAAELVGTKAAADAAGKSVSQLQNELTLLRETGAATRTEQTLLNDALRQAEGAFRGAAHEAGVYGLNHGQLIALLAGGALAAGLHHIAETGAEVEYQLASLNALSGSSQPINVDKFISISSGTLTSLKDAAEGVHALAQAGLDQQQAFAALPSVMRLSVLGEMSVAQAAEMAVESMHAFGKGVSDLESIGDILVAVGAKSNVSVQKLAEDMKSAATTGELFGMSMEEITAAVGTLAERGLTIQPLSSAMLKLYEPSAKASAVIKQLGLEIKDQATGAFRPFTDIITDLTAKLNTFSSAGAADTLKSMGFSSRDIKAMEAMTQHLGDYIHLLDAAHESQGKMFDAMLVKEDTVEGAWKRLTSTLEGTLVKGFENASPVIQQVENDLMHMFGSDGAANAVTDLAAGVARLTLFLVEHAKVLAGVAIAYGGLKIISSVTALTGEYLVAQERARIATEAERVSLAALTEQEALASVGTGALAAETTALEARMTLASTTARLFSASFGWIALAVTAAISAYELFGGKMTEVEAQRQKEINTHNTTIDAFDREIQRLKDMTEQLDKVGEAGAEAANKVALLHLQDDRTKAVENLQKSQQGTSSNGTGGYVGDMLAAQQRGKLKEAKDALDLIDEQIAEREQRSVDLANAQSANSFAVDKKDISKRLADLDVNLAEVSKINPNRLPELQKEVEGVQALTATEANHVDILKQVKKAQDDVNSAKLPGIKVPDSKGALSAQLAVEQGNIRLAQMRAQADLALAQSENRRGELGDLELINKQLQIKTDLANAELAAARHQADIAKGADKVAKEQQYQNKADQAKLQGTINVNAAEDARANLLDRMSQQELTYEAKTLAAKGQLVSAFDKQYEAQYGLVLDKLDSDIENADNAKYKAQLERYKKFLDDLKLAGEQDARFKMPEQKFGLTQSGLQNRLQDLAANSGEGAGLGAYMDNSARSLQAYQTALPQLIAYQKQMQKEASSPLGNPEQQKKALDALRAIDAEANRMRNIWVDAAKAIGKELSDAFGRGGKGIGDMLVAAETYGARMAQIQDNLKKDGNQDKAAADTMSAQIKGYGDMAAAAEGFFSTNSKGYKVLRTTEQVFRAWELALAIEALAKKTFLKEAEVAVNTTTNATKIAGEAAATGASVGLAATESSAWGVTAVVKALASLPFPLNLAAGAATLAAVIAVGAKMVGGLSGGHADTTATDRQAAVGTGSILGDTKAQSDSIAKSLDAVDKNTFQGLNVSLSMLDALRAIQSSVSTLGDTLYQNGLSTTLAPNTRGAASSAGNALGWIASPILNALTGGWLGSTFGKIGNAIFGGNSTTLDTGITLGSGTLGGLLANGANVGQYSDTKTSGGWFSSDKYNTGLTSLGSDVNDQFTKVIANMRAAILASAGVLGESGDTFTAKLDSFVVDIGKISTKDLKPEDVQKALETAMSKLGDDMAKFAVSDLQQFQKAGEGALQTLARIANDYQTVDTVMGALGMTFHAVGMASVGARERLIDLAGGLDKFTSQSEQFLKDFYTDKEQAAALQSRIAPVLSQYGLSTGGADPMKAFRDYVVGLDTSTEAGAQAYTTLINISSAFKQIVDAGKKATDEAKGLQDQLDQLTLTRVQLMEKERSALDPANQALYDQLQLAKGVADAKDALSQAYDTESQKIQQAIDRMKTFGDGIKKFRDQLALGDLSPLTPEQKYVEAKNQYELTLARAKAGNTDAQDNLQNVAQAFLQASRTIYASGDSYTSDYQRVTSAMDDMSKWATQQVDVQRSSLDQLRLQVSALIDIKAGVMTVAEAIDNLRLAQNSTSPDLQRNGLTDLYQELLGRSPDQAGLNFWMQQLQHGVTFNTIADFFKNSPEYAAHQSALSLVGNDVNVSSTMSNLNVQITNLNQQVANLQAGQTQQTGVLVQALGATSAAAANTIVDGNKAVAQEAAWSSANTVEFR